MSALGRLAPRLAVPLLMTAFLGATIVLFVYGPWPWPIANWTPLLVYLIGATLLFGLAGVAGALRRPGPPASSGYDEAILVKVAAYVGFGGVVLLSIGRTGSPVPLIPFRADAIVRHYGEFVAQNSVRSWHTLAEYGFALAFPFFLIAAHALMLRRNALSRGERVLTAAAVVIYLMVYAYTGVTRGVFQIVLLLPLTMGLFYVASGRLRRRPAIAAIIGLSLAAIAFVAIFSLTQESRDPEQSAGYFTQLGIHADRSGWIYGWLPPRLYPAYESVARYLVQGYYALSLALGETHYRLGFGLTNSMVVLRKAEAVLGEGWYHGTLLYALERDHGWPVYHLWHSIYVWLISDFGVAGSLIVVTLIGFAYGAVWRSLLDNASAVTLSLFYLLNMMIIFFPANNQVLQSADTLVALIVLAGLFSARWIGRGAAQAPPRS